MATATATKIEVPHVMTYDKLAEHEADMARRRKEQEAKAELLLRCIDPQVAMETELKKPQYKFTVECEWWASSPEVKPKDEKRGYMEISDDDDGRPSGRLVLKKEKRTVVAQNEADAWALFCDAIRQWPSPKLPGMTRSIKRSKEPVSSEMVMSLINARPSLGR